MAGLQANGQAAEILATRRGAFGIRLISRRERTAFVARFTDAQCDAAKRDEALAFLVGLCLCRTEAEGGGRVYAAGEELQALDMDADLFDLFAEAAQRLNLPPLKEDGGKAAGATPIAPSQPSSP